MTEPTTIWCVFQDFDHSTHSLVGIYSTKEFAEKALYAQMSWINDYHGPHYAPLWNNPDLFFAESNVSVYNNYGEHIYVESWLLDSQSPRRYA